MRYTVLLLALFLAITSCGNEAEDLLSEKLGAESEYIKTGITCGLCAGVCVDTLVVTPNKLLYKRTIWGEGDPKTELLEQAFTQKGWDNLIGLVDLQAFASLDQESCSRCADGCDYWLDIRSNGVDNAISFPFHKFPAQVDSLTKALNSIKEGLNEE